MVMVLAMAIMDMESVMLRLNQKPRLMLSMDMVLGTALILWDMVMDILATLPLAMVMDMVLATALILWDMVMDILATLPLAMAMDMVLAMAPMDMESVTLRLNPSPMLSMEPMAGMAMDLDTALTPWDMDMDMAMGMDMDIMV